MRAGSGAAAGSPLPPAPPGTPLLLGRPLLPVVAGRFTGEGSRTRGKPGISVEERNPTVHTHAPGVGAKWQCANVGRALVCVAKWIGPVTWQRLTAIDGRAIRLQTKIERSSIGRQLDEFG